MPIYEFKCGDCKTRFEEIVMPSRRTQKPACPKCNTRKVQRVMSGFNAGGSARRSGSSCGNCSKGSCSGCSCH